MEIWLSMQTRDGRERCFPVRKDRTMIGRSARCDVRVPLPCVGTRHCELVRSTNGIEIEVMDGAAATLHNGNPVTRARLTDADRLTVGPVEFTIRIGSPAGD